MCLLAAGAAYAQTSEGPQPPVVDPGGPGKAPSDAVVLLNGRDNSGWTTQTPSKCTVGDGVMICRTGAGDTQSTAKFRDAQIHGRRVPEESTRAISRITFGRRSQI